MATISEVKLKAAQKLGYGIKITLGAAWETQMQDAYDETYQELSSMGLVTWPQSSGLVPDKVANDFAGLMAWKRADVLATTETFQRLKPEQACFRDYKRAISRVYVSSSEVTDY